MMIQAGQRIQTPSGRTTSPAPKGSSSRGERALRNALKRLDGWLLQEAILEARFSKNDWLADMMGGWDAAKLSQSDRETLNDVLGLKR